MSSANGNNITESFNSIRGDDDLCVSCGKHGCASKSNLCIVCQKAMGIKKISARRLAQLGWTAENQDMMCCGEQMEFYDDEKPYYFYCPVCEESIETGEFDAEDSMDSSEFGDVGQGNDFGQMRAEEDYSPMDYSPFNNPDDFDPRTMEADDIVDWFQELPLVDRFRLNGWVASALVVGIAAFSGSWFAKNR